MIYWSKAILTWSVIAFQFILEGVTLKGSEGDIGVDDVTVLEESCHENAEWSNFIILSWIILITNFN